MSSMYQGFGAARKNVAAEILRISEAYGPIALVVRNLDDQELVLSVSRKSSGALVKLAEDTAEVGHAFAPAYTGNGVLLDFTGSVLAHYPIVPGSVTVKPTAGGGAVNCSDEDGDGNLYCYVGTPLVKTFCGTVNYFTGAVDLHFPATHAPAAGAITADFTHSVKTVANGIKTYQVPYLSPKDFETLIVKAASKLNSSRIRVVGFQSL